MKLNVQGRHMDVTPSLKSYVEKKLEKLNPLYEHILEVNVILEVEKLNHIAEATILTDNKTFYSEARTEQMYESIDKLFDKVDRQLKKYWEKISNKKAFTATSMIFNNPADEKDNKMPLLSEIIEVSPKPMTDYEAILQMKLSSKRFYLYNNSKDDNFGECVAIFNDDNDFTIIHPDGNEYLALNVGIQDNKIIEKKSNKIAVDDIVLNQAINKCLDHNDDYYVYYDVDYHNLNLLFKKKNETIGLLTSANIDDIPKNVKTENFVM